MTFEGRKHAQQKLVRHIEQIILLHVPLTFSIRTEHEGHGRVWVSIHSVDVITGAVPGASASCEAAICRPLRLQQQRQTPDATRRAD